MTPWRMQLAVRVLDRGGLVLHATEGVWGLACDPFDATAVQRLLMLKRREVGKGLIVIGSEPEAFALELEAIPDPARAQVVASWPGAVTWVLPNQRFPAWITGGRDSVAVRVPGHPQARALCRAFRGPLVSTSANRAGRPSPRNRFQALATLTRMRRARATGAIARAVHVLDGETLGRRHPSEIRTVSGETLRGSG